MGLSVDLTTASRGKLIHLIGELLSRIEALEARTAELEGQQKLPPDGPGGAETALLGQGQPAGRPQEGTQEAGPRLRQTARGADP